MKWKQMTVGVDDTKWPDVVPGVLIVLHPSGLVICEGLTDDKRFLYELYFVYLGGTWVECADAEDRYFNLPTNWVIA